MGVGAGKAGTGVGGVPEIFGAIACLAGDGVAVTGLVLFDWRTFFGFGAVGGGAGLGETGGGIFFPSTRKKARRRTRGNGKRDREKPRWRDVHDIHDTYLTYSQ